MDDVTIPGSALVLFSSIGGLLVSVISLLFLRYVSALEKRIADYEARLSASEQREKDAIQRELDWQDRAWAAVDGVARPALAELKEEKRRRRPR